MTAGIKSFLDKGTGPRQLRSALRSRTRSLGSLLRAVGAIGSVRAELPGEIWGGDIFGVMSKQLRELLEDGELRAVEPDIERANMSAFDEPVSFDGSNRFAFPSGNSPEGEGVNEFAQLKPAERAQRRLFAETNLTDGTRAPFALRSRDDAGLRDHPSGPISNSPGRSSFAGQGSAKAGRSDRKMASSLLDKKLGQYWETGESGKGLKKDSDQAPGQKSGHSIAAAGFAPQQFNTQAGRSWPEFTGGQVAKKLRSLVTDQPHAEHSIKARQTINSGSPEKVEIQNVFNIEVKAGSGNWANSEEELSEKISDILREQAIRHGIDVT